MRTLSLACLSLLALAACSNGSGVVEATDLPQADVLADVAADQAVGPDLPASPDTGVDLSPMDFGPGQDLAQDTGATCEGGGCFLDPCQDNSDCQSAWCVEHMGEGVCTRTCQEDCPPGWLCKQVGAAEPDLIFVCVSQQANLCKPCNNAADCKTVGGVDDVCVDYGDEGAFCGGTCKTTDDCPWGFLCSDAVTVNGIGTLQCVAEAGVCPCTEKSILLGLATDCENTNEFGTCAGQRICAQDGLTDCDAATPAPESCNGLDDDCDGEVDEPTLEGGEYILLCDDGNDCTQDQCTGTEGCVNEIVNAGDCNDGNPCTVADHCDGGTCVGTPLECDDNNQCTDNICTDLGGCEHPPVPGPCDDGDPCTLGDQCLDGQCAGTSVSCQCQADADCDALEDGDLCNGTLVCNLTGVPYLCEVDPATVVACPEPAGPDAFCLAAACAPETGLCSLAPANEGLLCDDGDPCTVSDSCQDGTCVAGDPVNCNDGNPCTDDSCSAEGGCQHASVPGSCEDGDPCTIGDYCEAGSCVSGNPLDCDDNNPCTQDACSADAGCVHAPLDEGPCDDGNACTTGDACVAGLCVAGELLDCDDGNVCTTNSCHPQTGCVSKLNQKPCNDGDICTLDDHCHLGECISSLELTCDDGDVCTDDGCNPQTGCSFVPNAAPCDDDNACTVGDQCAQGWCLPGPALECADGNPCTDDLCDPEAGCVYSQNQAPCDDGDPCTVDDLCQAGSCTPGEILDCDDGNPCTDDSCDPGVGCIHTNNEAPCEDGNACTTGDFCVAGACVTGPGTLECTDDNPCTDDGCNPEIGCIFVNNSVLCDDGNACTEPDLCNAGSCVSGDPVVCPDDGNTCTTHACDVDQGCVTTTLPDCCGNGQVEAGEECDDGNQAAGDGCSDQCQGELGSCFDDWMLGLPSNDPDCTIEETGYHWKGIYGEYACWWNTKNQAWNSPATNPYQLALFFGLDVSTGQVSWCYPFNGTPNPPSMGGCHGYCDINEVHMWGWCGGAPFTSGGWLCFKHGGKQPCN